MIKRHAWVNFRPFTFTKSSLRSWFRRRCWWGCVFTTTKRNFHTFTMSTSSGVGMRNLFFYLWLGTSPIFVGGAIWFHMAFGATSPAPPPFFSTPPFMRTIFSSATASIAQKEATFRRLSIIGFTHILVWARIGALWSRLHIFGVFTSGIHGLHLDIQLVPASCMERHLTFSHERLSIPFNTSWCNIHTQSRLGHLDPESDTLVELCEDARKTVQATHQKDGIRWLHLKFTKTKPSPPSPQRSQPFTKAGARTSTSCFRSEPRSARPPGWYALSTLKTLDTADMFRPLITSCLMDSGNALSSIRDPRCSTRSHALRFSGIGHQPLSIRISIICCIHRSSPPVCRVDGNVTDAWSNHRKPVLRDQRAHFSLTWSPTRPPRNGCSAPRWNLGSSPGPPPGGPPPGGPPTRSTMRHARGPPPPLPPWGFHGKRFGSFGSWGGPPLPLWPWGTFGGPWKDPPPPPPWPWGKFGGPPPPP